MRKPTYTSRSENATLLTAQQAQRRYQLSRTTLDRFAKEANAKIKLGTQIARYDRGKLDAYFGILSETL